MALVCFDTNFVIWGIKRQATAGQEDNVRKATYLLGQLSKQGKQILIPSIVLAEALAPLPAEQHGAFVKAMERAFVVAPFDSRAAVHFARMWKARVPDAKFTRSEMKADYQIAATALANKCEALYTGDDGLAKFARPHLPIVHIEEIVVPPEQAGLFE